MRGLAFVLSVLSLLCVACGAGAGTPSGAPPRAVVITSADDHRTVAAMVGDTVQVSLGPDLDWKLSVSDDSVLVPGARTGPLPSGTQGLYRAARTGAATVIGEGRPRCAPGQLCAQFIVAFQATVEVR